MHASVEHIAASIQWRLVIAFQLLYLLFCCCSCIGLGLFVPERGEAGSLHVHIPDDS